MTFWPSAFDISFSSGFTECLRWTVGGSSSAILCSHYLQRDDFEHFCIFPYGSLSTLKTIVRKIISNTFHTMRRSFSNRHRVSLEVRDNTTRLEIELFPVCTNLRSDFGVTSRQRAHRMTLIRCIRSLIFRHFLHKDDFF